MKKIFKSVIFIIIFIFLWNSIFNILSIEKNPITYFYKEPKNSLDIIYIGPSNAYEHFNTVLAYHKYGFTTGMLSADAQTIAITKNLINEGLKYQSPKLFVIDISTIATDNKIYTEGNIKTSLDVMRFSNNKINAIKQTLDYFDIDKKKHIEYFLTFTLYHKKWKYITKDNFTERKDLYKGYLFRQNTTVIKPQEKYVWDNNIKSKIPTKSRNALIDTINYIKDNNINVLFVISKRLFENENQNNGFGSYGQINDAISIVRENGLDIINFNDLEDYEIDFNNDLYNTQHLNVYGATKNTLYFAKYLKNKYNLKDHRNDKKYKSWDDEYERFSESFKTIIGKDFNEILSAYDKLF